jgi:hypothetical protein
VKTFTARSPAVALLTVTTALAIGLGLLAVACMHDSDEAPKPGGAGLVTRIAHEAVDAATEAAP